MATDISQIVQDLLQGASELRSDHFKMHGRKEARQIKDTRKVMEKASSLYRSFKDPLAYTAFGEYLDQLWASYTRSVAYDRRLRPNDQESPDGLKPFPPLISSKKVPQIDAASKVLPEIAAYELAYANADRNDSAQKQTLLDHAKRIFNAYDYGLHNVPEEKLLHRTWGKAVAEFSSIPEGYLDTRVTKLGFPTDMVNEFLAVDILFLGDLVTTSRDFYGGTRSWQRAKTIDK